MCFLNLIRWLSSWFVLGASLAFSAESEVPSFDADQSLLSSSRQLLVVVTDHWESVEGKLWLFERKEEGDSWKQRELPWRVVVGKHGMAWGIGEHGGPPPKRLRVKREGDGCAPAGIFSLVEAFGKSSAATAKVRHFPYRQMTPSMRGVDDSRSRDYNRIVDFTEIGKPDWQSAESMLRKDPLYDWGIVVAHNWQPFPERGSCIFLHTWKGPKIGTAGCTATPEERMISLVRWLSLAKKPLLVQLPASEYRAFEKRLQLPSLTNK